MRLEYKVNAVLEIAYCIQLTSVPKKQIHLDILTAMHRESLRVQRSGFGGTLRLRLSHVYNKSYNLIVETTRFSQRVKVEQTFPYASPQRWRNSNSDKALNLKQGNKD